MSNRWIPLTLGAATAIPFGLLGGFGPTGDHSILPWLGIVAGWTYQSPFHVELAGRRCSLSPEAAYQAPWFPRRLVDRQEERLPQARGQLSLVNSARSYPHAPCGIF